MSNVVTPNHALFPRFAGDTGGGGDAQGGGRGAADLAAMGGGLDSMGCLDGARLLPGGQRVSGEGEGGQVDR